MIHDFSKVFDTTDSDWQIVLDIFNKNEHYPKKRTPGRAFHHKFPKSCSRLLNESEDNDIDNMISLSFSEHIIVHYYYYKLAKEPFKSCMALAFKYMVDNDDISIINLTPDILKEISIKYEEATKVANEFSSKNLKNRTLSEETKEKISKSLIGHSLSEETKNKISETKRNNGYVISDETRLKLKTARAKQIRKPLDEEWKQKISKSKMGQKPSEETRKKMSESHKGHIGAFNGKHLTEEHKKSISETLKGIKRSDETKEKIGASKRGKHFILINGKKKLVSDEYINNIGENNE